MPFKALVISALALFLSAPVAALTPMGKLHKDAAKIKRDAAAQQAALMAAIAFEEPDEGVAMIQTNAQYG